MIRVRTPLLALVTLAAALAVAGDLARAQTSAVSAEAQNWFPAAPTPSTTGRTSAPSTSDALVSAPNHCSYAVVKGQRSQIFCGTGRQYAGRYKDVFLHTRIARAKSRRGEYREAVTHYEKAMTAAVQVDKRLSTAALEPFVELGTLLVDRGAYRSAERLWLTASPLFMNRGELPGFVVSLSWVYQSLGAFERARSVWTRPMTSTVGQVAWYGATAAFVHAIHQGWWHAERGDDRTCERSWREAERIAGQLPNPEMAVKARATVRTALGMLRWNQGQIGRAESQWRQGLEVLERAGLGNSAAIVAPLGGLIEAGARRRQATESLLRRALRSPRRGTETAVALSEIARRILARGEYEQAETVYREALVMSSIGFGDSVLAAEGLHDLGIVRAHAGEYDEAMTHMMQGLIRLEKQTLPDRVGIARVRMDLGWVAAAKRDTRRALEHWSRGNEILAAAAREAAETRIDRLAALSNIDESLSLHLTFMSGDPGAAAQAMRSVLHHKGRTLDALANRYRAARRREQHRLVVRLRALRSELATRSLATGAGSRARSRRRPKDREHESIAALEREIAVVERELERDLAEAHEEVLPTLGDIHEALPVGAVAVEFVVYRPVAFGERSSSPPTPRYAAYVADWRGRVRGVDLGPVDGIDALALRFREALSLPSTAATGATAGSSMDVGPVREVARALDERIMRPVRRLAPDASTYYIATDGFLAAIPLQALVDERGDYLVDALSLVYVDSVRELLRPPVTPPSRGVVIVADPDFDQAPQRRSGHARARGENAPRPGSRPIEFPPLRNAGVEARAIAAMFPGKRNRLLLGGEATEGAVKALDSPRVLHIATHGFFLPRVTGQPGPTGVSPASQRAVHIVRESTDQAAENPLLSSGIALAGANRPPDSQREEDGILTALEATSLQLAGTRLVVLSACDTGLGKTTVGDGVHGLRRALRIAGAETVVMSLWNVSDAATRDLMVLYYRHLLAGRGRSEALRAAQRDLLRDPRWAHPFYWAAFIASGDPRSLDAPDAAGATYITGKPWRRPIPGDPSRRVVSMLEFGWGPGGHLPARAASGAGLVPAAHLASAGISLRTWRGLVAGVSIDFTTADTAGAREWITRTGLAVRVGQNLMIDELPWLHPELTAELGVSWIRKLGMIDRTVDVGQRQDAIVPYAGLRVGALVDITSRFGLGFWLEGRHSLGTTTRTVYEQPDCEEPGCSAERWTVGGRTIGFHLSVRRELSW